MTVLVVVVDLSDDDDDDGEAPEPRLVPVVLLDRSAAALPLEAAALPLEDEGVVGSSSPMDGSTRVRLGGPTSRMPAHSLPRAASRSVVTLLCRATSRGSAPGDCVAPVAPRC